MGFSWGQLLFLSLLVSLTNAQRHEYQYCLGSDNYHTGIYEANRLTLLSSLASGTDKYGFYSSSLGENSETVYALVLCRGDIELTTCRSCINSSTGRLIQACPNSKAAFRGNDFCMLRYSNKAMKGIREDNPRKYFVNNESAPSVDQFNQSLRTLLDSLRGEAASGGSRRKFAANETKVHDSLTIYGYMQCTPDLSEHDCDDCLRVTTQDLWGCCNGTRKGVTVYKPSCVLRYETFPFLAEISSDEPGNPPGNGIPADAPGNEIPADVPENRSHTNQTAIIITVPILSITFLLIALACSFLLLRKKQNVKRRYNSGSLSNLAWIRSAANLFRASRQNGMHQAGEDETQSQSMDFSRFDFAMVRAATNDFSNGKKLGGGGFGSVYKGQLPNGQEIAVKRLANGAKQGQVEFKNEIVLLARLQHKNLVRLLGFCLEGEERLLVYEFVPNASLDHFIFDPIKRMLLYWEARYKIILGIVEGLVYLHQDSQLRIIHHDLKAGNVLLDREMNPKIADFGLARLFLVDQSRGNTKKFGGTIGYMPPEYAQCGQFSVKTDVFSFGVLVLEIVSGRKNNGSGEHLISYAWKKWRQGKASRLIDQTLRDGSESEKMRCIHIGLLCVQENVVRRPTMASVALMLNSFSMSLPLPSKPAFLMQNSVEANTALPEKFPSRVTSSDQSLEHTSPDQSLEFSVNPSVNNDDSITLPR